MKHLFLATVISASLMACNSDDSAPSVTQPTPQRVEGSIELVDLNTDKITVNGYSYKVDRIIYNNTDLALNQLQKDMTVTISTTVNEGTQVSLNPTIVGIVTQLSGNQFTINGVTLTFANLSNDINNGDWVMVSSLPAADGGYTVLSVVKFEDADLIGHAEIEGPISSLTQSEFRLANMITVDYSNASIDDNETLMNGQWVEVTGKMIDNKFNATEVEVENYDDLHDDNEIEGVITWVAKDFSSFELNSRGRFLINSRTEFDDGSRNSLTLGAMVEVSSIKQGSYRLATEIEFEGQDSDDWHKFEFEIDGIVRDITRTTDIVTSFKINNNTVLTDVNTVYDDGLNQVNFTDGMYVEVEGMIVDGNHVAREIELND